MGVVTTFLRAIRAGAVHFQHSATLLSHFGRLGPSFDLCAKVIVEILREEGLYKNNGDAVIAVVNQALRDVSSYLQSAAYILAKLFSSLSSCSWMASFVLKST